MKTGIRLLWLILVSLLVAPGMGTVAALASTGSTTISPISPNLLSTGTLAAVASTGSTGSTTPGAVSGAGESLVYLPLINQGYPLFNDAVSAFEPAASLGAFQAFDATPDPDGNQILVDQHV